LKTLLWLAALGLAFAGGYFWKSTRGGAPAGEKGGRKILYWVDPMHPAYKSDKPGIAPDCGMKLEPVYADSGGPAPAAADRKVLHYRDPKQHEYTSDKPGLNPETGNDLEPVYADDPASMPPGTVQVSAEKQQLIGVRYGAAELESGSRTIRAAGRVAYDETRIAHVHTKFEGWADKVFGDFVGQFVKKGQPLLTVYSPEMLASQRELLLAAKARATMTGNPFPAAIDHSESLLRAARLRLELWDLSEAQIEDVLRTGQPVKNITVYSPVDGYVLERKVFPNQKIAPDTDLYIVADLSRVWILADIFEYEAGNIRLGQPVRVTLSYAPGKAIHARVSYIQPQVDPMTRTLKVRLEAGNPGMLLKPDMYVDAEFRVDLPRRLTVPVDAVLDAGERKTVFVDRGNGYLEPRQVETGERLGGRVAILKGLQPGERIVVSGNFLIDSESQMRAAAAGAHQHD